jgi:hypothetical protein
LLTEKRGTGKTIFALTAAKLLEQAKALGLVQVMIGNGLDYGLVSSF